MDFTEQQIDAQFLETVSAAWAFDAAWRAMLMTKLAPEAAPWAAQMNAQIGTYGTQVQSWVDTSGYAYAATDLPAAILQLNMALQHANAKAQKLSDNDTPENRQRLSELIAPLLTPAKGLATWSTGYQAALQDMLVQMNAAQTKLQALITQVQTAETALSARIKQLNADVTALQTKINADRAAIAKAHKAERKDIKKVIFGIVLAPVTGGASLILAGIGAVSFEQAKDDVSSLTSNLSTAVAGLTADTADLAEDQRQAALLAAVALSGNSLLDAVRQVQTSVTQMVTTWTIFEGELTGVSADLKNTQKQNTVAVAKFWLDAACDTMAEAATSARTLLNQIIGTQHIQITPEKALELNI